MKISCYFTSTIAMVVMLATNNDQKTENWGTIRKSLFTLLIIAMFTTLAYSQNLKQTVRGTILDADSRLPLVFATIIAVPVSYIIMHKWLENFAYKTELSWWIFALAGLLALGIALLTVSWQSR